VGAAAWLRLADGYLILNALKGDLMADETVAEALAVWVRAERPSIEAMLALAGNDPDKARKVLKAEEIATRGKPRRTLETQLIRIAESE
jgi:hypothetical protein